MILRPLVALAAVLGPAWAAEFDPAAYRTLHFAGEMRQDGYLDAKAASAFCGPPIPVRGDSALPPGPPPLPSAAHLEPQPAGAVTAPGAAAVPVVATTNPHGGGKVRYYLNELAASAKDGFPVGAWIVKEKWRKADDAEPTIITVMEKLSGAKEVSSWSFRMYDCATRQDLTAAYLRQSSTSCVDCHARWEGTGFVSPQGLALIRRKSP